MYCTKRAKLIPLIMVTALLIPNIGRSNKGKPGEVKTISTANAENSKIIIDTISEDLWSDVQLKDEQCYEQLFKQHNEETLPPLLQPYYSDHGLDVDSLIQDEGALTAYFETGCLRIHHKTFMVVDYPIDIDSHYAFLGGVGDAKFTPIMTGVETEIRAQGDKFVVSYIVYSGVLKDDLSKEYRPEKFQEIGYQLFPDWRSPNTEYFEIAYRQDPEIFSLPAIPGKIKRVRIQTTEGRRFKSKEEGILTMVAESTEYKRINYSDFRLFESF